METLTQHTCHVIPPFVLQNIADGRDRDARDTAIATIAQMKSLATQCEHTLIDTREWVSTPTIPPGKSRNVYDGQHHTALPGKLRLSEGGPKSTDVEINEAYEGAGLTYDFYSFKFGRNSIDGKGLRIDSTVHYGAKFDNAMWNGKQMVYGDGDGKLFNRFTGSVDVIGHEITHGVTQYTAALDYSGQSGALNEHVSDAFGIMIKQFALNQPAKESDWLIGASLLAPGVKGKAIRSMAAPGTAYDDPNLGKDPQPAHMKKYVETADDNGGVHINSGIPNHAFYLAATAVGGFTWTSVGKVWFETLTKRVTPHAKFIHFAKDTVSVAGGLFGTGSSVQRAIASSWAAVGLTVSTPPPAQRSSVAFLPCAYRPPQPPAAQLNL